VIGKGAPSAARSASQAESALAKTPDAVRAAAKDVDSFLARNAAQIDKKVGQHLADADKTFGQLPRAVRDAAAGEFRYLIGPTLSNPTSTVVARGYTDITSSTTGLTVRISNASGEFISAFRPWVVIKN
jgi:hypothetical protein